MKLNQIYPQKQLQIINYFLQPTVRNAGNQMLQTIKNNQNFPKICNRIGWVFSDLAEPLITLDKDYVCMNACHRISDQKNNMSIQKLSKSVQQLQQLQMKLDCLISQISDKTDWIKNKCSQCIKNKQQTMEDCQILTHQNLKLANQYQVSQKQNKNQQNSTGKGQSKISQTKELSMMLDKYKCKGGFPKNKNDALRLLNSLQVMIQKLEVQKLSLQ